MTSNVETGTVAHGSDESGKPRLSLFTVMSPWHPKDASEGTFEYEVWATDHDDARRELAVRMAESAGVTDPDDVDEWVEDHLETTGHMMVVGEVLPGLQSTISDLLSGPEGEMSEEAKADYQTIMAILSKHVPMAAN